MGQEKHRVLLFRALSLLSLTTGVLDIPDPSAAALIEARTAVGMSHSCLYRRGKKRKAPVRLN